MREDERIIRDRVSAELFAAMTESMRTSLDEALEVSVMTVLARSREAWDSLGSPDAVTYDEVASNLRRLGTIISCQTVLLRSLSVIDGEEEYNGSIN